MPTSIPEIADMLNYVSGRNGQPLEDIAKDVDKWAQKTYSPVISKQQRLMTFLYIKNVLNITLPAFAASVGGKVITIEEAMKSVVLSGVSIQGYLVRLWGYTNKSGHQAIGFQLMDKTNSIGGFINFDDALEVWSAAHLKKGDFITINNGRVNEWNGSRNFNIGGHSTVIKPEKPEFELQDLVKPIGELVNGHDYVIQGSFLTIEEIPYMGCPTCTSSFAPKKPRKKEESDESGPISDEVANEETEFFDEDQYKHDKDRYSKIKEGDRVKCKKCGEVEAKKLAIVKGKFSDGENDIDVNVWPRNSVDISPDGIYMFYGKREHKSNVFGVDDVLSAVATGPKISDKFSGVASLDSIKRQIPMAIHSMGGKTGMKEDSIMQSLRGYLGSPDEVIKDALSQLVTEGALTLKDGVYKAVKIE